MAYRTRTLIALLAFVVTFAFAAAAPQAGRAAEARASAWCPSATTWQVARTRVGDTVRLKARVASVYFARSARGRPTFIDLGFAYPNPRRLTLLIWGRDRSNFPTAPERMFRPGTLVCAQGVIASYRGVAQMEVGVWDARARLLSF